MILAHIDFHMGSGLTAPHGIVRDREFAWLALTGKPASAEPHKPSTILEAGAYLTDETEEKTYSGKMDDDGTLSDLKIFTCQGGKSRPELDRKRLSRGRPDLRLQSGRQADG